ncbi:MAG: PRC-barrel domain protein [Firmicutes bacterium]|nr:PRC-barrel domain protein [Bacillota bacterium]
MQKLSDVIGLPVLEKTSGSQIGEVQEVVLNYAKKVVTGVIVSEATWFSHDRGILFQDFVNFGQYAINVQDGKVVQDFSNVLNSVDICGFQTIVGKELYTAQGNYLGILADFVFDPSTGNVKLLELSDGVVTDFVYGRMAVPLTPVLGVMEDRLIVSERMQKLLQALNHKPSEVD